MGELPFSRVVCGSSSPIKGSLEGTFAFVGAKFTRKNERMPENGRLVVARSQGVQTWQREIAQFPKVRRSGPGEEKGKATAKGNAQPKKDAKAKAARRNKEKDTEERKRNN